MVQLLQHRLQRKQRSQGLYVPMRGLCMLPHRPLAVKGQRECDSTERDSIIHIRMSALESHRYRALLRFSYRDTRTAEVVGVRRVIIHQSRAVRLYSSQMQCTYQRPHNSRCRIFLLLACRFNTIIPVALPLPKTARRHLPRPHHICTPSRSERIIHCSRSWSLLATGSLVTLLAPVGSVESIETTLPHYPPIRALRVRRMSVVAAAAGLRIPSTRPSPRPMKKPARRRPTAAVVACRRLEHRALSRTPAWWQLHLVECYSNPSPP